MPSPPRERGRPTRPRSSEEEFVLFLQGIPARCRWQELKDLVRQTASHIRQAVVYDDNHGFPTGLGQIIVKNEDEAWRTYDRLSADGWEGQSLVVTLARTSSPTRPIAGPTKSPHCLISPNYIAGFSTPPRILQNMVIPPSPISAESAISSGPTYHGAEYGAMLSPIAVPHQPFVQIYTDPLSQSAAALPHSPALHASLGDPMGVGFIPTYVVSHPMHPPTIANNIISNHVNTSALRKSVYSYSNHPAPTYSRRTILMQNLDPTTTPQELHAFLQENVVIEHCELIHVDTSFNAQTARCKTSARVTTRSTEEAKHAVALYNNTFFKGFRIRVKLDRSTTPTAACTPGFTDYAPWPNNLSTCGMGQTLPTPPTSESSSSDTDDLSRGKQDPQCEETKGSPNSERKPLERCQPLVVNGSGIGTRAAVTT
ncbi:RNA-binding protein [Aspergillus lucknowensis]|uniref:RRM domain-containing protein n=1 Tax=Aspergillus lucknowensis TaxID=176173 RepID=A0ABR4LHA8_9EURO